MVAGRPSLTLVVDVHSRCILGWLLSFEPPSLYSVIECIRRANRPKPRMRDLFPDCPELADIYGKCDEIVVDNGLEFIGTSFESGMTDLGVSIRWAPVKSPTYKAIVERFFSTLNSMLHKKLPGGTFPLQKLREWDIDPQKFAVLSLEQTEALLDLAIGVYHQSLHRTLGDTPVRTWVRGMNADIGRVCRLFEAALVHALRRGANKLEGVDISWATEHWAMEQAFIDRNPFAGKADG